MLLAARQWVAAAAGCMQRTPTEWWGCWEGGCGAEHCVSACWRSRCSSTLTSFEIGLLWGRGGGSATDVAEARSIPHRHSENAATNIFVARAISWPIAATKQPAPCIRRLAAGLPPAHRTEVSDAGVCHTVFASPAEGVFSVAPAIPIDLWRARPERWLRVPHWGKAPLRADDDCACGSGDGGGWVRRRDGDRAAKATACVAADGPPRCVGTCGCQLRRGHEYGAEQQAAGADAD